MILTGPKATAIRLRLLASLVWKRFAHPKAFPLLKLSPANQGVLKSVAMRRKLHLHKLIKNNGRYFLSLEKPHFPSRAFDRMVARGGLSITAAGTSRKQNIEMVILAVSHLCHYNCEHCYERHNLQRASSKSEIDRSTWIETISQLQQAGTGVIVLSGGEPMADYQGILSILSQCDTSLSDFHMHTSGHGVTVEKATALKQAGLVAAGIGLDDWNPDRFNAIRGRKDAFDNALNGIDCFNRGGVVSYINCCLSKKLVEPGELEKLCLLAQRHNIAAIRLMNPKACGGYSTISPDAMLNTGDTSEVSAMVKRFNSDHAFKKMPAVYYADFLESVENMGCLMGGLTHFYIDTKGNVAPCVFIPISFGNIGQEPIQKILSRMKEKMPMPGTISCVSHLLAPVITAKQKPNGADPVDFNSVQREWKSIVLERS